MDDGYGDYYSLTKYAIKGDFKYDKKGYYKSGSAEKWSAQDLVTPDQDFKKDIKSWFYIKDEPIGSLTGLQLVLSGTDIKYSPISPPWKQLNGIDQISNEYGEWAKFYKQDNSPWYLDPFSGDYITSGNSSAGSAYEQYYTDLTSGDAALTSKKMKWDKLTDFASVGADFYNAVKWDYVNISKLQKYQSKDAIDWTLVAFDEFEANQYKQTNWSQVSVSSFTSFEYTEIDWGQVSYSGKKSITKASGLDWTQVNFNQIFASPKAYKKISWSEVSFSSFSSADYQDIQWDKVAFKGKKSVSYSALDWSKINFNQFEKKNYKQVNWKEAQTTQLTDSQYSAINWSLVALKGKKSANYSKLNWSKVINNDSFSAKAAKKVDWNQISASSLDSTALSKLQDDAFSGKNKKLTAWLDANNSITGSGAQNGVSFASIGQLQAPGAVMSVQDNTGGSTEVLLAAVEKQPTLV